MSNRSHENGSGEVITLSLFTNFNKRTNIMCARSADQTDT